ncbi:MAG: DUF1800 domain-containing protein, partial [Planctomycetota bacterium]
PAHPSRLNAEFEQLLHGQSVTGDLSLTTSTRLRDAKNLDPPSVQLLLNRTPVATQTTLNPTFHVPHQLLKEGPNTLQLRIEHPKAGHSTSTTHTVNALTLKDDYPTDPKPTATARFSVTDPRWDGPKPTRDPRAGNPVTFAFHANGRATLNLPPELEGRFELVLDARGDHFQGPPLAEATLARQADQRVLEPLPIDRQYHNHHAGQIVLQRGAKSLTIAFANDLYDAESKGDRNLYLRAVELRPVRRPDTTPPDGTVVYPKPDALLAVADAVVVDVRENRRLREAEILLNGKPTGLIFATPTTQARHLLPLPLRGIPNGTHTLAIRLTDHAGNTSTTPTVSVQTRQGPTDQPTTYQLAVHLLNRFAFGPDPQQLADLLALGTEAYLRQQLTHTPENPDHLAAQRAARSRFPDFGNHQHLIARGLAAPLQSRQPVRHRFTLFIKNHFNTWIRKVGGDRKAKEAQRFAELGPAPFIDLLLASAKSPAMLNYLDQQSSRGKRINENYARELLELHTVGVHGGYTQEDVTTLAHALPGWTTTSGGQYAPIVFRFDPVQSSPDGRRVFGFRLDEATPAFRYERALRIFRMLARHPQTARYLATKLAEHYTQAPADPALIDHLAHTFHTSGGDTAEMLIALALHPAFRQAIDAPRLAHPFPFALGLGRAVQTLDPYPLDRYLNATGTRLFDRETPDGYPDTDPDYADSNAFTQRWRFAYALRYLLANTIPATLRDPPQNAKPGSPEHAAWADRLIDLLALRVTGQPLGPRSHAAAEKLLAASTSTGYNRLTTLATFIAQTPEASLR